MELIICTYCEVLCPLINLNLLVLIFVMADRLYDIDIYPG